MDFASRYADAIPLKRVDARTTADAMMQIFSQTGIPREILTNQGSNFMSATIRSLCEMLGVEHIRTSPYHPQTNGMLERFHHTLKQMFRKCSKSKREWDNILHLLLFAYRCTPHSTTGFTPFELLFGRDARGPLNVLLEAWTQPNHTSQTVVDYVLQQRETLESMAEVARRTEEEHKRKTKTWYDQKTRNWIFNEGDEVLVLHPCRQDKLSCNWDGPYPIHKRLTDVT